MRRLLVLLAVLALLAFGADRLAAWGAGRLLAQRLQRIEHLPNRPTVGFAGFPFLTQVAGGVYRQVTVRATDVPAGPVRLTSVTATLTGVHVPPAALVPGAVHRIPVDALTVRAVISLASLSSSLAGRGLRLRDSHGRLQVIGSIDVFGHTVRATALAAVRLIGHRLQVAAADATLTVPGLPVAVPLSARLSTTVTIGALPFGLRPTGLQVVVGALVLTAAAGATVLPG